MYNLGLHGRDLVGRREQISVPTFPPNSTSLYQPMGMGIIGAKNSRNWEIILRAFAQNFETRDCRGGQHSEVQYGMCGIAEGFDLLLLDVSQTLLASWTPLADLTIAHCSVRSGVFPLAYEAEIFSQFGRRADESKNRGCHGTCSYVYKVIVRGQLSWSQLPANMSFTNSVRGVRLVAHRGRHKVV